MKVSQALRVLGLAPGAGQDDVRTAWLDLAKVWHPDRFAHDERLRAKAERNLQRINEAYETLRAGDTRSPSMAARITASFSAILGLGDLGSAPNGADGAGATPGRAESPIGARHSLRVLGLGVRRSGTMSPRRSSGAAATIAMIAAAIAGIIALLLVLQ